jgi:iron complex outermembrane receptor protein
MSYSPENLLAYEAGFKHQRSFYRLNGAVFYYDYKNFQAFTFNGLTQQIGNLPANVKGAELELLLSPDDRLDLTFGGSYLSTRVKDVVTPVVGSVPGATVTDDRHMVLAPKFTLNGIARYHFNIAGDRELAFQVDSRYTGKQHFDLINSPIATENGRAVTNASISLADADNRWTASVSVKNLTNRQYRLYVVPLTFLGQMQQLYGTPRWYSVTVGYQW